MPQESTTIVYYMVVNEQPTGPYTLDEITLHPALTPETLVWKPGIENWVAAKTFPELLPAFTSQQGQNPPGFNGYNPGGQKEEPREPGYGTPGANGNEAPQDNSYSERRENNPFADNPQYNPGHSYEPRGGYRQYPPNQGPYHHGPYGNDPLHNNPYHHYHNDYRPDYRPSMRTNWLPWAIVATVVGFFASCIGAIFGIIGIVQSNKANTLYAQGYEREGDAANSNARVMTIIGLIFAGIGIVAFFFFGSFFGSFNY